MTKTRIRRRRFLAIAVLFLATSGSRSIDAQDVVANVPTPALKPNIILFLVDDMGWQDTSVPFHTKPTIWNRLYRTPNMEELARRGIKFTNAYAAHPVCSPTRTSLMTGKNPARTHVSDWVGHGMSRNRYLESPPWKSTGLQPGDGNRTLPAILRSAGYRTIHIGKAHFGGQGTPGANPLNLGFDVNVAGSHGGGPWGGWYSPWLGKYKEMYPGLEDRPQGEYLTDAITARAVDLISQAARDQVPFFMNMAQFAVHTQIAPAPKRYVDHYRDGRPVVERDYASMLEAMDASLGAIMRRLRDPNQDGDSSDSIADNTIILFMSDNGGLSNHTRYAKGQITLEGGDQVDYRRDFHNSPLKSGKGSAYEGGIRVPMIVAWAGQSPNEPPIQTRLGIQPGSRSDEPVHADDFFPTILAIASVANPVPPDQLDGVDLRPLMQGRKLRRTAALFWHYPHQWYRDIGVGLGIEPFTAMRDGDFKLIYFYGDGVVDGKGDDPRWELYNLAQDIGEEQNLVFAKPRLAAKLRKKLIDWMVRVGAQTPISKITGKPLELAALPVLGAAKRIDLGSDIELEIVYIPPGEFYMGSTAAEKKWAVGAEGGAAFSSGGGVREAYEGPPRLMRVRDGFWIGRTEVTVGQFRRFVAETGYVTDAEKPGGTTMCFDHSWVPGELGKPPHPWKAMADKSWRDPNHGIPQRDDHPVVCVSYNDMQAFCRWLTKRERAAKQLSKRQVYRLPTEAEWAYACRGGRRDSSSYWWGNDLNDAKGRLNISANDPLPGKNNPWPGVKLRWSDGFPMVSPVDYYGRRGRNGFGLADMCGGVWEFVTDHFDPAGGHEKVHYEDAQQRTVSRPVCRGGNYYDVPGNARCAVRLGIHSVTYSDSRDGFRICLGVPLEQATSGGK